MIDNNGKPMSREQLRASIAVYNEGARGSKAYAALPRALATILDNLAIGKTGYVKGTDGQLQVTRRKDKTIVVT